MAMPLVVLRRGCKTLSRMLTIADRTSPHVAAASLLSQEIWDQIIDHLHDEKGALKSSVLVCRAFVRRSQLHIFASARLLAPSKRLRKILSCSAHLLDYVCDLSIWKCDAKTLTHLAHLSWPRLSTISVSYYSGRKKPLPAIDLLCILVSLPTLRSLSISSSSFTLEDIHTILASCSSSLLSFRFCGEPEMSQTAIRNFPLTRTVPRPRITHLDLDLWVILTTSSILDLILDSGGPFDLSCLTHFNSDGIVALGIPRVVLSVQHTLQHLEIIGIEPGMESLDFGAFPVLSHITVKSIAPPGMDAIAHSARSSVRTITCHAHLPGWPDMATQLQDLENAILAADMPELTRVEVRVFRYNPLRTVSRAPRWMTRIRGQRPPVEVEPTVEQLVAGAKEQMPGLGQRGLLVVEPGIPEHDRRAPWI
ncbi:hypothetical protein DFH06DRAFT_190747 [Mycena polygramma]|nr:hypothetical protein DFH06DRAFT_190747 [Mycena polygramma]